MRARVKAVLKVIAIAVMVMVFLLAVVAFDLLGAAHVCLGGQRACVCPWRRSAARSIVTYKEQRAGEEGRQKAAG